MRAGMVCLHKMRSHTTLRNLPSNSRFYILCFSVVLSVYVAAQLRLQIAGDQLFFIRLEQTYGLVSLCYLYVALLISPLSKLVGKKPWMGIVLFSRRAIGVSAFGFALLHALVAVWGQLDGLRGVLLLPAIFQWSLAFGAAMLFILLLMALTSFDKVIRFMTFRKWKWLHRFVYIGSVLVLLHVWLIGTHVAYDAVQLGGFAAIALLLGLETWRMTRELAKKYPEFGRKPEFYTLILATWVMCMTLLFLLPSIVSNYHSAHEGAGHMQMEKGMQHGHR
jgi:methionine sulfoxide reductase heme-binding subunit